MRASWVPTSLTMPPALLTFSIKKILSALRMVLKRWAMTMVLRLEPSARRPSRAAWTRRSDSLSNADVASSRSKIRGSLMMARAMEMRCFWPPETRPPPMPTLVSYPSGMRSMNSCALAVIAAAITCSRVATPPGIPAAMLSCTLPENSVGSCSTKPTLDLNHIKSRSDKSTPSMRILPALAPCTAILNSCSLPSPMVWLTRTIS
mmetsp:Transcript_1429/g.5214  ORF Transcript_1429/g.5214 Transcript_1429/m.5214 type:complete len:205 (+) Transcript_1429:116-730(+)